MESCLTHLEGSRSGNRFDADVLQRLDPEDGAPLLARYDMDQAARTMAPSAMILRRDPGMWAWREILPVRDRANIVSLGEGETPLLNAPRMASALGLERLLVKAEGGNPTGSFKARGMSAAVSRAKELGVTSLIAPSAGNAAGALAAYGAAADMVVTVVMPADTPEANIVESQISGATVHLVDGFISDCGRVAEAIAAISGAWDVSTMKEPYRVEGKKTMGLELVWDLGWEVPDVVVYPTGGGTGLVGMWKAFAELSELGIIGTARPRMVSVQAAGCAPIVEAFERGADHAEPWPHPYTRASGLRVPSAVGDRLILQALRESDGTAVAVPEEEIDSVQRLAGRRGVGYVSPETAAAFAAVGELVDSGWLDPGERVVVFDTGIGQKYPPPPLKRPMVMEPSIATDPEALRSLLGGGPIVRGVEPVPVPPAPTPVPTPVGVPAPDQSAPGLLGVPPELSSSPSRPAPDSATPPAGSATVPIEPLPQPPPR